MAFVNEEPPFFYWGKMGSRVYAKAARARGEDIRLMISLEMLGYYSEELGSQRYPACLDSSTQTGRTSSASCPTSTPVASLAGRLS
ncbi:MAG: hypothetical protein M3436_17885 [Pseudomonadota bacterium]|nr:hypothetical protein [Pseudomonadota bacterium]